MYFCHIGESGIVGQHTFPAPWWPYTQSVKFRSPFDERPTVTDGLFVLDCDNRNNLRVSTTVTAVTRTVFWVKFSTWAGTVLYGAKLTGWHVESKIIERFCTCFHLKI